MASGKPSQELLDSQFLQNTPQYTSVPAKYHSSALPPFPYRLAGNGRGFRRVGNFTVNPKVPIPRAAHTEAPAKLRARQACSYCREQKAKCTGRQPCQRCEEKGVDCIYGLRSRDVLDRAWRMLGTAFQSAVAMGLHLRNSANEVQFSSKEIRYRVWWALFVMDSSLQAITGRPPKTDTHFCTTPLPMPYREEDLADNAIRHLHTDVHARNQFLGPFLFFTGVADHTTGLRPSGCTQMAGSKSRKEIADERIIQGVKNNVASATPATSVTSEASAAPKLSLFFVHAVDLAHLTHKAIGILYSPQPPQRSFSDLEVLISGFNDSMDQWLLHLPQDFNFTISHNLPSCSAQTAICVSIFLSICGKALPASCLRNAGSSAIHGRSRLALWHHPMLAGAALYHDGYYCPDGRTLVALRRPI
ncbi:hypothetical protein PENSUB_1803 [Penicillium subrubescens]|uniref:Zn(2)-C6 fungal-type domain-containing protein n=1 Tax=Penicillium subrubescens TaxID=1316194 RepID=A0A1Q5UJA8_9EURO|nr:hypothetical protein PENSUB_1803 [Penicillium subrubescens]